MDKAVPVTRETHHVIGDHLFVVLAEASRRSSRELHRRLAPPAADVPVVREPPQRAD